MVAQSHGVASKFLGGVVQGPAAELGAEGAGVGLLAHVKNDAGDLGGDHVVGDLQPLAQGADASVGVGGHFLALIGLDGAKAHVHRNGDQLKGLGVETAQTRHGVEQGQGILARRDAHGDPVPRADHGVVVHGAAGITQYVFHVIHKSSFGE